MTDLHPPIPDRTTEQLLDIIETKEQWRDEVVDLAQRELISRGIPIDKQEKRRTIRNRFERRIADVKARATFTTWEKLFIVLFGVIVILILRDVTLFYSGKGFRRKNMQGIFYLLVGVVFWIMVLIIYDSVTR